MRDADQWARVQEAVREIFETAVELGGTLSGEHGVGVLKRAYMESALGSDSIDVQRRIKQALDPKGILCPGKVLPELNVSGA
jgi:glycolate oxidase